MRRGAVALAVVLVALTGSVDAAPRHTGAPQASLPDHCLDYRPGDRGLATSEDGTLTVYLDAWTFADGAGGYHGIEYRAWGPHAVTQQAAGMQERWRGFSVAPVDAIRFCATGPGFGPPLA